MITIDQSVQGKVVLAYFTMENTRCYEKLEALWEVMLQLAVHYRQQFNSPAEANALLQPARRLYRKIGLEPTRYRPSSEALLRRALQGKSFYQINSIVDCGNYCSLSYLLPIGLYDLDTISGKIVARLGKPDETYAGIGKTEQHAKGKLVLTDDNGPFGNPSADSYRTRITLETNRILWVIYAPADYSRKELTMHLNFSMQQMCSYHPGKVSNWGIIE